MAEHKSITSDPLPPGMDFSLLRREGIEEIARLAGDVWTDHNAHDPGITILEQLCFVLTDLGYRLSFPMRDLLTPSDKDPHKNIKQFFTPAEALTSGPLTADDYRRLLIDIQGVRNARVEPSPMGLYRALLEIDAGVSENDVIQTVAAVLHGNRNLCEDFEEILVLPVEDISLRGAIDLEEGAHVDPNMLMARLHFELDRFISPSARFVSLSELLNQGRGVENIYGGPRLSHGFPDDEGLGKIMTRQELRVSEIISVILKTPGIKAVRELDLSNKAVPAQDNDWETWVLPLSAGMTPRLKGLDRMLDDAADTGALEFYKAGIRVKTDDTAGEGNKVRMARAQLARQAQSAAAGFKDIPIPRGAYRNLNKYESVQHEFPANYGIGDAGIPGSASPRRRAQAKQLQAYLMIFDQILADFNEQLAHVKDLFAVENGAEDGEIRTYFEQTLLHEPGAEDLFTEGYAGELPGLAEGDSLPEARKNRFLDHLLARFGETFPDPSLLLHDLSENIRHKTEFLKNYPEIGEQRARAFNYTDASRLWDTKNISGLKRRICMKLGIADCTRRNLASADDEGFHIMEHILLSPPAAPSDNPYSFRISYVFPDWPEPRFTDENFKRLVHEILSAETPAHIAFQALWLSKAEMEDFETDYKAWLTKKADIKADEEEVNEAARKVLDKIAAVDG
ncbi:MAG: hypothetical protein GY849_15820 [Deltaproteobacteria bacterium]|nr:hypothetical protein [Deltaproteobacteria bacterium]